MTIERMKRLETRLSISAKLITLSALADEYQLAALKYRKGDNARGISFNLSFNYEANRAYP